LDGRVGDAAIGKTEPDRPLYAGVVLRLYGTEPADELARLGEGGARQLLCSEPLFHEPFIPASHFLKMTIMASIAPRARRRPRGAVRKVLMSTMPTIEPAVSQPAAPCPVATIVDARERDLGGFTVRRTLPSAARRMVGPFTFFDHFGPVDFRPGQGMSVRPHPHIGLATVTYLFEGEIVHRDSLGSHQ